MGKKCLLLPRNFHLLKNHYTPILFTHLPHLVVPVRLSAFKKPYRKQNQENERCRNDQQRLDETDAPHAAAWPISGSLKCLVPRRGSHAASLHAESFFATSWHASLPPPARRRLSNSLLSSWPFAGDFAKGTNGGGFQGAIEGNIGNGVIPVVPGRFHDLRRERGRWQGFDGRGVGEIDAEHGVIGVSIALVSLPSHSKPGASLFVHCA